MPRTPRRIARGCRGASLLGLLAILALCQVASARAGEFVVIANAENPIERGEQARSQVARLFLKRASEWPNGAPAFPFDRPSDSAAHKAFIENVLDTSQSRLDDWWLRLKQERGATPPRAVGSASFLIRAVKRKTGAFGFARKDEVQPVPDGVRVLFEFSGT